MANASPPLISLIVPVYGVEDYIADCLDSIFGARGFAENCELVIVDDGSVDNSMAIAESRCAGRPNVTIVRQANAGLGAARNTGLAHSSGRYVWFVDSDDEISRDAILVLSACIDRHSPDIIAFEFETIGGTLKRAPYLAIYDRLVDPINFLISGRPPSPVQFYAFSRDALRHERLQFHPGIYHEDALFTALALTKLASLVRLREIGYRYRLRAGSIMSLNRPEKHLVDMLNIAEMLAADAGTRPSASKALKALGREIGFALAGARHYAARTAPELRRQAAPVKRLLKLGRRWWCHFSGRDLVNYIRLLGLVVLSSRTSGS